MNLKAVIVDDEIDAVKFISSIVEEYCPNITIVGKAYNAKTGVSTIKKANPDLVFLDVEMPHGSGFDLLAKFPDKTFDVIFITAFNHYAIKAIKFSAIDYILKPINIKEFLSAVTKVFRSKENKEQSPSYDALFENLRSGTPSKLAIPTSEGMEYLNTKEIIRIEADRSYSWFFLSNGRKILVSRNLKEYQELLNDRHFFRTHNSHLVNLEYVKKFVRQDGGYVEMTDGSHVSISRGKKELFLAHMNKLTH